MGRRTCNDRSVEDRHAAHSAAQAPGIPAALAPAYFFRDRLGLVYASLALLTCLPFVHAAWRFLMLQDRPSARRLFFVSIIQLPILLIAMVAEAVLRAVAQ